MTRLFIMIAFIITLCTTAVAANRLKCGTREQVVQFLDRYNETPQSMGLGENGQLFEMFASNTGTWTIVMTLPNGTACMMAAGTDWQVKTKTF